MTRISDESALTSYGYVQLAHVLEHVSEPLQMAGRVGQLVQPSGYLLLEVPQDVDAETLRQLQAGKVAATVTIHEHINLYSVQALRGLIQGLGFEILALEEIPVDTALGHQTFIRGLARRSVNWNYGLQLGLAPRGCRSASSLRRRKRTSEHLSG